MDKIGSRWHVKIAFSLVTLLGISSASAYEQIHVGFLWHMHQPIYYPYESLIDTDYYNRFSFSVVDVHNQRFGPYTTWPYDAVQAGSGQPHLGAQVSFTGSLIENLNNLEAAGVNGGMWNNWDWGYDQGVSMSTTLGHPRLDLVAFGYHHPLMPLLDELDIRMQIKLHKHIHGQTWTGGPTYSNGMFPAETAFSTRMIPALVAEGIDWVLVDNIHFDRACLGYPHTNDSGLFAPNPADQINPNPVDSGGAWVQLNDLWAPSQVSAPFGYQPHYVQHIDPETGTITQMIAVPAARYEGNEDGRGGYGAFLYDQVMDQYIMYNTDPAHPMIVVLHHDGDNYGGGSDAYYHNNFQNMVNWVSGDPDYDVSTIDDYLDRFPPDPSDVIHVEDGSWSGADNGDPEFKKWLADPDAGGWSPDRNSWAVLTAAKNRVFSAEAVAPAANMQNIMAGSGSNTEKAWHWLLCGQASDYWYWDGTEIWDSNVTRACNQAVYFADLVLAGQPDDTPPTIFLPQREPYNPGGYEWGSTPEPSDFEVWTYADDISTLTSVTLKWRVDNDGVNPLSSIQNETYVGGAEVGSWNSEPMTSSDVPPQGGVLTPTYRALRWSAMLTGQQDVLIDYYIEAVDGMGNVAQSPIQHVYIGVGGSGGDPVTIDPDPAVAGENVTISYDPAGRVLASAPQVYLHYGFNNWNPTISPDPAMTWNASESVWQITVMVQSTATQLDMVFNDGAGTWDNNDGADWHFTVTGGTPGEWVMDGQLDAGATLVAENGALQLYAGLLGTMLYVAAPDAGEGNDHFIFLADTPGPLQSAPWAKAGQVAGWSAYLGNENDNGWSGWFDAAGAAQSATGGGSGWLEGTIDLSQEFGQLPEVVYLTFAAYGTSDGAPLIPEAQVPTSVNSDGNVDASEYAPFTLTSVCPGDSNCDGSISWRDIDFFVAAMNDNVAAWEAMFAPGTPDCSFDNNDVNADGTVSWRDIDPLVALMNTTCP
ncbi:MAG: hypothetical protein KAY37_07545 [Phycisphaerae bacterium]|nr:hypothetical protein [Phycisphaerae bacterium]